MRHLTLEVPSEVIGAFTERLIDMGFENSIVGKNDDDEIEIEIVYEKDQALQIDELEEYLEELIEGLDEEESEEEEDKS